MPFTADPRHLAAGYDVVVVGAGPAGMAAALGARDRGAERLLLIDHEAEPGGILQQCVHAGFGQHVFAEEMTGPQYAQRYLEQVLDRDVDVLTNAYVLGVSPTRRVQVTSSSLGVTGIDAATVVLATGARERTRAAVRIPPERPSGVMTAGAAQRMVNLEGQLPGRRAVILGSGDVGLIMARRLALEGVEVLGVFELLPYPSGLPRNVTQCLTDLDIPLHLSTTVVGIHGRERLERVTVAPVDEAGQPLLASAYDLACDTLLLSIGLMPDAQMAASLGAQIDPLTGGPVVSGTMETTLPGIFAAGNVVHVNDLADWVSQEARVAGEGAGALATGAGRPDEDVHVVAGDNVAYLVPHTLARSDQHTVSCRVRAPIHGPSVVRLGGVTRHRLRSALPAELVRLEITPQLLEAAGDVTDHGDQLRVDVVPAEQADR